MRIHPIPYGRQSIDAADVAAVTATLESEWLTTGPRVADFERAFARTVEVPDAAAVSSGTAALHAAVHVADVGPGDEVIVPAMTFAATANAVVYEGGRPVFADVDRDTLLVDPEAVAAAITPRTKAIIAVDYAGQPCNYDALRQIAERHGLVLIADASHAIGARYRDAAVGGVADLTTFSFHPVKHITTGEGGIVTSRSSELTARVRQFRNHGISTDHREREQRSTFAYEMVELGYNYRLTDLQCALGLAQLAKAPAWLERRRAIAARYDEAFRAHPVISPLRVNEDVTHAYHLYVVRLAVEQVPGGRDATFRALRSAGIGVNVHYLPVHLHPFYRRRFGTAAGLCPVAEDAYSRILSIPMFPTLTDDDVTCVVETIETVLATEAA